MCCLFDVEHSVYLVAVKFTLSWEMISFSIFCVSYQIRPQRAAMVAGFLVSPDRGGAATTLTKTILGCG